MARGPKNPKVFLGVGIAAIVVGVLGVAAGCFATIYIPIALEEGIREQIIIDSPEAKSFSHWVTNGGDNPAIHDFYYLFNITNVDEVRQGKPPFLVETGPYVYRHVQTKLDPIFLENGEKVSFYLENQWFWEESLSKGKRDDMITNINPGYLGVMMQTGSEIALTVALSCPQIREIITQDIQESFSARVFAQITPNLLQKTYSNILASSKYLKRDVKKFLDVFVNGTSVPVGDTADLWQGMQISVRTAIASHISLQSAELLFSSVKYSLVDNDVSSTGYWFRAAQGNETASSFLKAQFSLTDSQLQILLDWYLNEFTPIRAAPEAVNMFNLKPDSTSFADIKKAISFAQFAVSEIAFKLFGVDSIVNVIPDEISYPQPPEYGVWMKHNFHGNLPQGVINTDQMIELLSGQYGLFDPTNLNVLLSNSANASEEMRFFGITQQQEEMFLMYLVMNIVPNFVTKQYIPYLFEHGSGLFTSRKVEDILFSGSDPLVGKLIGDESSSISINHNATNPGFVRSNYARDIVYTGKGNINNLGNFTVFNGSSMMRDEWASAHFVFGTSGDAFPPGDHERLTVFAPDLSMELFMVKGKQEIIQGITLNDYSVDIREFDINPDWDIDSVRGFINLTRQQGTPLFICNPYFFNSQDDWVSGKLENFPKANAEKHNSFIGVEPNTGMTMHAHKRLMFNFYIPPKSEANWFNVYNKDVLRGQFYPLMWLDEHAEITPALADEFKTQIYGTKQMAEIMTYVGFIVGGLCLISGIVLVVIYRKRRAEIELSAPHERESLVSPA